MSIPLTNVLSIGNNPNLSFYNWKLFESKICNLTVITNTNSQNNYFQFQSNSFGNSRFTLNKIFQNLQQFNNSMANELNLNFEFIFISAISLQEITTICSNLTFIIEKSIENGVKPTLIMESTDYVNLESTVKKCLQISNIDVLAIMSDFDIRIINENSFKIMESKKESELIYIGKGSYESTKYSNNEVNLINKLGNLLENIGFDVYKLSTPLEFLSYQWKFALPQIVLGPLSIIFEQPYPEELYEYLLAKPLISGLILEIISVIRSMNCKLFKGYDNENSLIQRCIQLNPKQDNISGNYLETPKLFYNFYNQNDLYLDLLLLQPIFLADDFQIKTPYLEFLYAVLSKINENNSSDLSNDISILWLRKNDVNLKMIQLKNQQNETELLQQQQLQQQQLQLQQQQQPQQKNGNANPEEIPYQGRDTPQGNDNFEDLTDIAIYGAQLNGESFSPQQDFSRSLPPPQQQPIPNNIYAQQSYQRQSSQKPLPLMTQQYPPQQQYYNNYPQQLPPPQMAQYPQSPTVGSIHQQVPPQQQFPPQRRMSSMPLYANSQPMQLSGPPKPTSRKNRRSLYPAPSLSNLSAAGVDFGGVGGMPGHRSMMGPAPVGNGAPRLKHQSSYNMMNGSASNIARPRPQHGSSTSLYGINGYNQTQPQQPQQGAQQFQGIGDISTSTVLQNPLQLQQLGQQQMSNSSGGSLNISSDEIQKQLQPPVDINMENGNSNGNGISHTFNTPEPKPLGYTPGDAKSPETEDKKKKKKKSFFSRKKKNDKD